MENQLNMSSNMNMNNISNKRFITKPNGFFLTKIPVNEQDLKLMVVDLFQKDLIPLPIDSLHLYRSIKKKFRNFENSIYMLNRLDINSIISSLVNEECLICDEMIISFRTCYFIKAIDYQRLNSYAQKLKGLTASEPLDEDKMKFLIYESLNNKSNKENILNAKLNKDFRVRQVRKVDDILDACLSLNHYNDFSEYKNKYTLEDILGNSNKNPMISNLDGLEGELEEEDQNLINSIFYQPTAKKLLSQNHDEDEEVNKTQTTADVSSGKSNYTFSYFKQKYNSSLKPFCNYGTRADCIKKNKKRDKCDLIHFKPVINNHTDTTLGDCSYLDTCRHMDICKFVHYEVEENENIISNRKELVLSSNSGSLPSQWINCDIRLFDLKILGNFEVIMADPPWDIHMDLPYGTLTDEEMKGIKVGNLQTDGVIFLWVTGRAAELARECLDIWGYDRVEELVWIKTNQLQRLIRTGRTGHWLNHSKEHCLIGIKGNPKINKNVDCDVLVSEVRETSRKPDEVYELIERMSPHGRKIELFARAHNRRHGWVSLGNQLPGVYLVEEDVINRFNDSFPEKKLTKEYMEINRLKSIETKKA